MIIVIIYHKIDDKIINEYAISMERIHYYFIISWNILNIQPTTDHPFRWHFKLTASVDLISIIS